MTDYLFFLTARDGVDLARWFLEEAGPEIVANSDCTGLRVNVAVPAPGDGPLYKIEPREGGAFDVTLDLACPDEDAFARLMEVWMPQIDARTAANFGYRVTRLVEHDNPGALTGNPAPGYKIMRGFYFHEDLSPVSARRSWDHHVGAALRLHGFDRYVRYWIEAPVTPGAPPIGGATNLQFGTDADVLDRYFTQPGGMEQITQDVGHFIARGLARVFTREHILK